MNNIGEIASLQLYDYTDALNPTRLFLYKYNKFPNIIGLNPSKEKRKCIDGITFKFDIEKLITYIDSINRDDLSNKFYHSSINRIEDVDETGKLYNKRIIICIAGYNAIIHSREEIIQDTNHQDITSDYIEVYYDNYSQVEPLIKKIWEITYEEIKRDKANLYAIKQTMSGFELTPQVIKKNDVDVNSNYNDDFADADKVIRDFISKENEHGIIILNGAMGTGKTHYIRHLINTNPDTTFILGTKNIAEQIAEPSFIEFLSQNQNTVLILEDCENIVRKRSMNEGSAITNLLNVGDGLLSDSLKIKIIVTFNTDLKNIDTALQRKGRLRYQYTFDNLCKEKSIALLKKLGYKIDKVTKPMSLADIYNYGKENNIAVKENVIGFN